MGKQIIALQNGNEVKIYVQLQDDSYRHNGKKDSHFFLWFPAGEETGLIIPSRFPLQLYLLPRNGQQLANTPAGVPG